ncbi:ROK family protein [Dickeya chrysanthemi Ech1591]|uniref:ROK family protein n=1 Tax=Dickeya chrysanthemi (strain Ech1591) TaxID=561229 RepID=C6CHN4_DICC1|nr:ROK family protein [Dickeya chrysanthemi]ACT06935.1 ROK family protein [Dickeya chrysanthemi Ech1591]WJM86579.1 ROK family protein [Dickeya chrysanthemi]
MRPILHDNESITVNERLVLDIVRRHRCIMRSAVSPQTNLTQPSVHRIIDNLLDRGLLRLGESIVHGRGKPSPALELAPSARYSIGISVNTDTLAFCLCDFSCQVLHEETLDLPPDDRTRAMFTLKTRIRKALQQYAIPAQAVVGVGFAIAGYLMEEKRLFNAPEPLHDWSLVDLKSELETLFDLEVWTENNATTGAIGESVLGAGLHYPTFGYLSFNYGFGAGLILNGQPFCGSFGNAGEISRIYTEQEFPSRPALGELLKRLNARGINIRQVSALRQQFDPQWPGVHEWVDEVKPYLNRAIDALRAVVDPAAIVFGGELPVALGEMLLSVPPTQQPPRYGQAARYPRLLLSKIQYDPAVIGAALMPFKARYFT